MYRKSYYIALRKREKEDYFWEDKKFLFKEYKPKNKKYWIADPFLFESKGITYIFYELYDRIKRRGCTGYSVVEKNSVTKPTIVIEKAYHLSFPYVFEQNGDIYMIPETSEINCIRLFKAIKFPDKWIDVSLVENIHSCDTIIAFDGQKQAGLITSKMFRNPPYNKMTSCYVQNIFIPFTWVKNRIIVSKQSIVLSEGDFGVRNAGALINVKGKVVRSGQDCRKNMYGNGIVFYEVKIYNHIGKYNSESSRKKNWKNIFKDRVMRNC